MVLVSAKQGISLISNIKNHTVSLMFIEWFPPTAVSWIVLFRLHQQLRNDNTDTQRQIIVTTKENNSNYKGK